jgi:hypothetical protein
LFFWFALPMVAQSPVTLQQDMHHNVSAPQGGQPGNTHIGVVPMIPPSAKKTSSTTDTLVLVTSQAAQSATDSVSWTQIGADGTLLGASLSALSVGGLAITGSLAGANSVPAVVCAATGCSWTGSGFAAGDTVIWTSDAANGGNGPLTLSFGRNIAGAGALIQADGPGQFTSQIQAFDGTTLLGTFTVTSNANGDAVYIGVQDQTGANITSLTFSLTSCVGSCTDFALDTAYLNAALATTASLTLSPTTVNVGSSGSVVMTATVAATTGTGAPTGSVNFFVNGGTAVGSGTLSSGTATFNYNPGALAAGTYALTSTYLGDTNFAASTSTAQTLSVQDFTIASNSETITVTAGLTGTSDLTVTPLGGFSQTLSYTCSGLPSESNCTFTSAGANSETLSFSTTAPSYARSSKAPFGRSGNVFYALLLTGLLGLVLPASRRKRTLRHVLPLLTVLVLTLWMLACSSSGSSSGGHHDAGTTKGTYPIIVTASTSGAAGTLSHSLTINLSVQ